MPNLKRWGIDRGPRWATLLLLMVVVLCMADVAVAWACPSCKAAAAASEGGGDVVAGFFWSILFMMSMPFLLLGSFSGYMYLEVRKARARQRSASSAHATTVASVPSDELVEV